MKCTILLSAFVSVLGLQLTAAAENKIPDFNIKATCQAEPSCTKDEQEAHDQLAKQWAQFRQSDASRCVGEATAGGGNPSYVELLTCLQADKINEATPTDPLGRLPSIEK